MNIKISGTHGVLDVAGSAKAHTFAFKAWIASLLGRVAPLSSMPLRHVAFGGGAEREASLRISRSLDCFSESSTLKLC